MTFLERALPYAQMGIPVFPLQPCKKEPALPGAWQEYATTDEAQIRKWNEDNPDYNCGLVAKDEGFLFLEFDIPRGLNCAAEEMKQPLASAITRIHNSGKGFVHAIYRQTDRTREIGNRSANLPVFCDDPTCPKRTKELEEKKDKRHAHEWFSYRQHNRYVVGPGSIHPNGNEYAVRRDVEPIPCPDWVCDWIERHTVAAKKSKDNPPVNENFDFIDFCNWYELDIIAVDGAWHIPSICPVAGYQHEQSVRTGFYWDGANLGWHCFAQGCAGSSMRIGDVIRHMNQNHAPYPEDIWERREKEEINLDAVDWLEQEGTLEVASTPVGTPEVQKEMCPRGPGCQCGLEHQIPVVRPVVKSVTLDDVAEKVAVAVPEDDVTDPLGAEPAPKSESSSHIFSGEEILAALTLCDPEQPIPDQPLEHYLEREPEPIPKEALYGRMAEWARALDMPMSAAYPAMLAAYSAVPPFNKILGVPINLLSIE